MRDTDTEEGEPAPRGAAVVRKSPACEACAREYLPATRSAPCLRWLAGLAGLATAVLGRKFSL